MERSLTLDEQTAAEIDGQVDELERQIRQINKRVADLRRKRPPEKVDDYTFLDASGRDAKLSSLFNGRDELILIHNMGRDCSYCTMWADGFVGLLPHLMSRAAFVVTTPDKPEAQEEFRRSRGWNFPMYSTEKTNFAADMGFDGGDDGLMPGVSVFQKDEEGRIFRVGRAEFEPGDDFCAVWHFFDLLPRGIDGWEPRLNYELARLERTR